MLKRTLTRTARAFLLVVATAALTSQVAQANLNVNGTDNGTFTTNATMTYNSDPTDPTVVSSSQIILGNGNNNNGSLTINSGSLTLTGNDFETIIGQVGATAAVNVNGGSLTINSSALFLGNASDWGNGSNASINMTGGTFAVNGGSFIVGRDGDGKGQINIDGGLLTSNATSFALSGGGFNGGTRGVVTFGLGAGELRLTNLNSLTINNTGTSYFNFTTGSAGLLSINGYTQSQFDSLVSAGSIRVDGVTAAAGQFSYTSNGGLGTYQLAAVPEPATVGFAIAGACGLLAWHRRRRNNS